MRNNEYDECLYNDLLNCCLSIEPAKRDYADNVYELQQRVISAYDDGSISEEQYNELSEYISLSQLRHGDI